MGRPYIDEKTDEKTALTWKKKRNKIPLEGVVQVSGNRIFPGACGKLVFSSSRPAADCKEDEEDEKGIFF
jgi:hypothetical protein